VETRRFSGQARVDFEGRHDAGPQWATERVYSTPQPVRSPMFGATAPGDLRDVRLWRGARGATLPGTLESSPAAVRSQHARAWERSMKLNDPRRYHVDPRPTRRAAPVAHLRTSQSLPMRSATSVLTCVADGSRDGVCPGVADGTGLLLKGWPMSSRGDPVRDTVRAGELVSERRSRWMVAIADSAFPSELCTFAGAEALYVFASELEGTCDSFWRMAGWVECRCA